MKITVFGGSSPKEGSTAYQQAYELGRNLALAGHTVLTGGYHGTMEAVSKGSHEVGGYVIGVTCTQIEDWRPGKANAWVKEEHKHPTLQERLIDLIESCDAAIALPGGPGTLAEIALTWNLMIIQAIPNKPLILVGDYWQQTIAHFVDNFSTYINSYQREYIQYAKDINQASLMIEEYQDQKTLKEHE